MEFDLFFRRKILLSAGCLLLAALVVWYSPMNPWNRLTVTTDQAVFLTIARGICNGQLAYVDFFDHKGPLLYLFLALGLRLGGLTGCFILEYLICTLTFFFMVRTAGLFADGWVAFCSCAIIFLSNIGLFSHSNSEEYMMPLLCLALWLFFKQITGNIRFAEVFVIGFTGMLVFFIKYNYCLVWVFFGAGLLVHMLFQSAPLRKIGGMILSFGAGLVCAAVPFLLYLAFTGSFDAFMDAYVLYSVHYAGYTGLHERLESLRFLLTSSPLAVSLVLLGILLVVYAARGAVKKSSAPDLRRKVYVCLWVLLFAAVLAAATASPGQSWIYYLQATMPMYIAPLAFIGNEIQRVLSKKLPAAVSGAAVTVLGLLLISSHLNASEYVIKEDPSAESIRQVTAIITAENGPEDTVISFSNDCSVYFYSDSRIASRILFPSAAIVDASLEEELFADLSDRPPRFISMHAGWKNGLTEEMILRTERLLDKDYEPVYDDGIRCLYRYREVL